MHIYIYIFQIRLHLRLYSTCSLPHRYRSAWRTLRPRRRRLFFDCAAPMCRASRSAPRGNWPSCRRRLGWGFHVRKLWVYQRIGFYPLVNVYRTKWKITMFNGKIHYKWQFSTAMLNYQRVTFFESWWKSDSLSRNRVSNALTWCLFCNNQSSNPCSNSYSGWWFGAFFIFT